MLISELNALPPDAPRILLATGNLAGEGFDHPPLDTLVLAMLVSWKGNLQKYAGRLHREHVGKTDVRIIDFVDSDYPALLRMWDKRQQGYKAMGYRIVTENDSGSDQNSAKLTLMIWALWKALPTGSRCCIRGRCWRKVRWLRFRRMSE